MAASPTLQRLYASGGPEAIIATLELQIPTGSGTEIIRLVHEYEDQVLGVDGVMQTFAACSIELALPAKDTTGNQTLTFGLGLVDGRSERLVEQALEQGETSYLVYREYISTDKSAPARTPIRMVISGGQFDGPTVQVEGSYYDMLNAAWPRERYTVAKAPGVKYLD